MAWNVEGKIEDEWKVQRFKTIVVKEDILRLQVPVQDAFPVQVLEAQCDFPDGR